MANESAPTPDSPAATAPSDSESDYSQPAPSNSDSDSPPPPPSESNESSPAPPSSDSESPPSPPPTNAGNDSSPPPPASKDNSGGSSSSSSSTTYSPPPPPYSSSSSSSSSLKSTTTTALAPPPPPTSNSSSTSSTTTSDKLPLVIGVSIGIGLLAILFIALSIVCCMRKKRKRHDDMYYYGSASHKGHRANEYYPTAQYPNPNNPGKVPPLPGGPWMAPPASHTTSSGDGSSNYHNSALPPPSPGVSLGTFNSNFFTYDELAMATNGFTQANLLGQGGFGYVHKGVLPNGKEVAVKSLKAGSGQGEREFQAEVEIISRVHHRHLVSLVGYCIAGSQRMLVYEFVPNNTMEYHLHGQGRPIMDWETRLRIAIGSAKGLAYLHEDCHPRIIHRDIKAANILLDNNFEAMVADFGLAKLSEDNNTHVSTRVMGTFGYLAPEYASSGKLTEKSDVFSFGIMLLELITGKKPVGCDMITEDSLVDWARPLLTCALEQGNYDGLVDANMEGNYNRQEMARMVACASAGMRHSAKKRPKMSQIVRALEGEVSLDDLNEGFRARHSPVFDSANGTSIYDTAAYNADMRRLREVALSSSQDSSDFGGTSSSDSREMFGSHNKL